MVWRFFLSLLLMFCLLGWPAVGEAALLDRINEAFRNVHGRLPTQAEWAYWASRLQRGEKTTFASLVGAMGYQQVHGGGGTVNGRVLPAVDPAGGFEIEKHFYASPQNPNALPDGTLITAAGHGAVYYVRGGKRSWVLPSVLDRWLTENHFFKQDIIVKLSAADLARYPQTSSINHLYIGKVLQHPGGTQYFIDDKLRKRELPDSVRSALKIPSGNLYQASAAHLREFATGPKLTAERYPGGMVVYTGAWHGGQIWQIREASGGTLMKHLYMTDYIYEADGNPDESQRALAVPSLFNKHPRGANIDRYADGWVVGLGVNIYVVQGGALRLITSAQLFDALGYRQAQVLRVHPEFLRRYPQGQPIRAFKGLVAQGVSAAKGAPQAAPNTANNLTRVRPHIRTLIANINTIALRYYDRELTASENKHWVDYVYNGEVTDEETLRVRMAAAAKSGRLPARTSRTATLSEEKLEQHWFPYLFYFVHQSEPSEDDKEYWYRRITTGDRDTIEKLGGTLQWVKENFNGATRR